MPDIDAKKLQANFKERSDTMTLLLGLTGSISTGKSLAGRIFLDQGLPVIDADIAAREVVAPGTEGLKKIKDHFGKKVILPNGKLDRKALGTIIFTDDHERNVLNAILADHIKEWIEEQKKLVLGTHPPIIVLDIPLLYEHGYDAAVDKVMVVAVPEDIQLKRLMKRDNIDEETALKKIHAQFPIDEKIRKADIVIDNSGTKEQTKEQIMEWLSDNFVDQTKSS